MKKNKFALVGLSALALSFVATNTVALAESKSAPTIGDVIFEQDEDGTGGIIKPGTPGDPEDIITPEEGGSTVGPLRINHVPNFHFGTRKLSTEQATYHPTVEKYTQLSTEKYAPHFAQIADARGSMTATWKLTVSGTVFSPGVATNPQLSNSYISLGEETLLNNVYDATTPAETLDRVVGFGTAGVTIPTDGSSVAVMSVKAGKNTNSTVTSSVFNATYTKDTVYAATDENTGVSLVVPSSDIKVNGETYKSDLTWTLEDTI